MPQKPVCGRGSVGNGLSWGVWQGSLVGRTVHEGDEVGKVEGANERKVARIARQENLLLVNG